MFFELFSLPFPLSRVFVQRTYNRTFIHVSIQTLKFWSNASHETFVRIHVTHNSWPILNVRRRTIHVQHGAPECLVVWIGVSGLASFGVLCLLFLVALCRCFWSLLQGQNVYILCL